MSNKSRTFLNGKRAKTEPDFSNDWQNLKHLFHKKRAESQQDLIVQDRFPEQIFDLDDEIFEGILIENEEEIELEEAKTEQEFWVWIENWGAEF